MLLSRIGRSRLVCILTLASLCLPASTAHARATNLADIPVSRMGESWWRQRFAEKQKEIHHSNPQLLWIGDSITQNWERVGPPDRYNLAPIWREFYGSRHAINLGFRGDSTCHVLWRLEHGELDGIRPRAIVLLVGANNFGRVHTDAAQTEIGIRSIISLIHRRLPQARLLVIGVLPSLRSQWVTKNTNLLDDHLDRLPAEEGPWLRYRDLRLLFLRNGKVDPDLYMDPYLVPPEAPLHPTARAQRAIAEAIEPDIRAMLSE